jgi:hypothetical protein
MSKLIKYHIKGLHKIEQATNFESPLSLILLAVVIFVLSYIPKWILSFALSSFTSTSLITDSSTISSRFDISSKGGSSPAGGAGQGGQLGTL